MKTRIEWLMWDLCVKYGLCLPPAEYDRLISSPPQSIDSFTDAVFVSEGLDPKFEDKDLRRMVRDRVREYFEAEQTHSRRVNK